MNYYNAQQKLTFTGVYVGCIQGGYVFHLENDDIIDFEQVNQKVLQEFDLKSNQFKNKSFEITYSENFDDLDDEDIVVFRLESLKLL